MTLSWHFVRRWNHRRRIDCWQRKIVEINVSCRAFSCQDRNSQVTVKSVCAGRFIKRFKVSNAWKTAGECKCQWNKNLGFTLKQDRQQDRNYVSRKGWKQEKLWVVEIFGTYLQSPGNPIAYDFREACNLKVSCENTLQRDFLRR